VEEKTLAIRRHHAGRFLPAMLQLVQTQICHGGGFTVIVYRHHAAFVFEFVAALQTAQGLSPG
jgi:prenyltransferase beta subunit